MTDDADDPMDRLFERMREAPPPDLEERILAATRDPAFVERYRLEALDATARRWFMPGLFAMAASVLLAAGVHWTTVSSSGSATMAASDPWRDVLVLDTPDPARAVWPTEES